MMNFALNVVAFFAAMLVGAYLGTITSLNTAIVVALATFIGISRCG